MLIVLISLFLGLAQAEDSIDETAQERLIEKLNQVNLNLAPNDPTKISIALRLADLYAERGRRNSAKELNAGCTKCTAGDADREKAIRLYNESLPAVDNEQKARVMTQVGHLHELLGREAKAISIYEGLLNEKNAKIMAEAQLSLAEIYFKKRNYPLALNFYQKVKANHPSQKGLATYRVGWCHFNMGNVQPAVSELMTVLKSKELLSRSASGIVSVDKQFQEEVSRDLATFIARTPFKAAVLDELFELSPDNARLAHLSYLASEYERHGEVQAAIASWRYVIQRQSDPKARLEGHVHLAQLQAQHKNQAEAVKDFETSLALWKQLGDCKDDTCKQMRVRLKQFVLGWNALEKKTPSRELLEAYQRYLTVFSDEVDMRLWQAQVAAQVKEHELAVKENLAVAKELHADAKNLDKTKKEWLETALLAAIENAELAKKPELENQATQAYLDLSLDRKKEIDVQYQRAHAVYEAGKSAEAAEQMRAIALNTKAPKEIRSKAADLSLDSLVLMKDDVRLEQWSKDFARAMPLQAMSFLGVARKSVLTQSSQIATSGDSEKAWAVLNRFDANGADQDEKINYLKNKLILAEKMKKLPEARDAADQLLRQPGLKAEDAQFALSRKAWLAELQFDFPTALTATEKISTGLTPEAKSLKLALLAELSQKDPAPYYRKFVQESKDKEKTVAVVSQLVKTSSNPLKELEQYKSIIAQKPEFYTEILYEVYAKTGKFEVLAKATAKPEFLVTPYGKAALRSEMLNKYQATKEKFSKSTIDGSNQRKLAAGLKSRVALLEGAEKLTAQAVDQQEWASQIVLMGLLAEEHQRFYNELLSLPMPAGLTPEQEQEYLGLLSQQAAPHQTKANDIKAKLKEIYANKEAFAKYRQQVSDEREPTRKVFARELAVVRAAVPQELAGQLSDVNEAAGDVKPSLADVEKARQGVRETPFDGGKIEALLRLEKQLGRTSMVTYLQSRLETLKDGPSI